MPIIITITHSNNNYESFDKILKNIFNGDCEIFYNGQVQGNQDYKLISAIENNDTFKIYYRNELNKPFIYLGETNISKIIKYRNAPINTIANPNDRLLIHLIIKSEHIFNINIPENNFNGSGKYKKDIFIHSNIPINSNTNVGFYVI
jgi:hypothetical protein